MGGLLLRPITDLPLLVILLCVFATLFSSSSAQTCKSQSFSDGRTFSACNDLPSLNGFLHWTYFPENGSVSIAYRATPVASGGWIAWGINPTQLKMQGTQSLIAFVGSSGVTSYTTPVNDYQPAMTNATLSFDVPSISAESSGNDVIIYATIVLPGNKTTVNQVWQTGPVSGGAPSVHAMANANKLSVASIDLLSGQTSSSGSSDLASRLTQRNIHGVLNAISWGTLMPMGIIIARYMRVFKSMDPLWFYLHITCQFSAYVLGVAGWATGLKLGSESVGVEYSSHRNIGITLFVFATLQVFAMLLRPKKDHKYRFYWNIYHHSIGYSTIVLSIINIFKGFDILDPDQKWKRVYVGVLIALAAIAFVLEVITWMVVLKRRSRDNEKSHHGITSNGYGGRQVA